jgi:general stress protein 26
MATVTKTEEKEFLAAVEAATKKAIWCALATVYRNGRPRVRMVHPTWEGSTLWFATGTGSPKHRQLERTPYVDVQFQVAPPDFVHIVARGPAEIVTDPAEKKRVWDVIDYDLSQFWRGGPEDSGYTLVRILPERIELSKLFGSVDKRVWRRG